MSDQLTGSRPAGAKLPASKLPAPKVPASKVVRRKAQPTPAPTPTPTSTPSPIPTAALAPATQDPASLVDEIAIKPVILTTIICLLFALLGHAVIWASYAFEWQRDVPWQPVAGMSLTGVALVAFGGFYVASRRARMAIAASFLLTFLATLPFVLTIRDLGAATTGDAEGLFDDFRDIVGLIVGFYFASEAAVSGLKVFQSGRPGTDSADVRRADRDLAPPAQGSQIQPAGG